MAPAAQLHQYPTRLSSFDKKRPATQKALQWPFKADSTLASAELALAGFHHCPTKTTPLRTRCFLCQLEVVDWAEGEDPVATHAELSAECGLAIIRSEEWGGVRPQGEWPAAWGEDGAGWPRSARWQLAREATFSVGWPHEGKAGFPTKEEVAAAGWTFQADAHDGADRCVCPFCARTVENWEEGDEPLALHKRKLGLKCPFFLAKEPKPAAAKPTSKLTKSRSKSKVHLPEHDDAAAQEEAKLARATKSRKAKASIASVALSSDHESEVAAPALKKSTRSGRASKKPVSVVEEAEEVVGEDHEEEVEVEVKPKRTRKGSTLADEPVLSKSTRSSKSRSTNHSVPQVVEEEDKSGHDTTPLVSKAKERAKAQPEPGFTESDKEEGKAEEKEAPAPAPKPAKKKVAPIKKSKSSKKVHTLPDAPPAPVEPSPAPVTPPISPNPIRSPLALRPTNSPHHSTAPLTQAPAPATPKPLPTIKAYAPGPNPFAAMLEAPTEEERAMTLEEWQDWSGRREQDRLDKELEKGISEFEGGVEVVRARLVGMVEEARRRAEGARNARA